jgi:hypothetical protein
MNSGGLNKSANAGRAPLIDHPGDHYDTPACAVRALLRAEKLPRVIWEPACGTGNIVRVLQDAGHDVFASDICDRGCPNMFRLDFLNHDLPTDGGDAIVTNPPYSLAEKFVARALEKAPLVIMLLRLAFMESVKRAPLLDTGKLARIHVFANRLPLMHRENWTGPRASSAIAFAWYGWDRDHRGPATIDRIFWEKSE